MRTRSLLGLAIVAGFTLGTLAWAQDRPGSTTQDDRDHTGQAQTGQQGQYGQHGQSGTQAGAPKWGKSKTAEMSPQQIATMMDDTTRSLAENIQVAERHTRGGKAFRAEYRPRTSTDMTKTTPGSTTAQTGQAGQAGRTETKPGQPSQPTQPGQPGQPGTESDRTGMAGTSTTTRTGQEDEGELVCVVWVLTSDGKINEVHVDADSGQVIRDSASLGAPEDMRGTAGATNTARRGQ